MFNSRRNFLRGVGAAAATAATKPIWSRDFHVAGLRNSKLLEGNPIVKGKGLCDPHIRVYGEHAYLYGTHDALPGSDRFIMNNWWVWRSEDLIHWKQVSILRPEETYWGRPYDECWATDSMARNGKYYFYFSRGPEEIGVVEGDSPAGPWRDPLGKPLIAKGSTPTLARDPGILQEEDGTSYIVFGCWDYYLARLNEDMISLAERPRLIRLNRKMGPYGPGKLDDKPYLHKRNGIYYLSWGCYYAMSSNIYGPYIYKDSILKVEDTSPVFRGRLTMDRHGSFFELHNQWYFICNDQDWPGTTPYYRDSVISYVHYRDNGEINTLDLNPIGVGQYDAAEPDLKAADYFRATDAKVGECAEGGFEVRDIHEDSRLVYPNIRNVPARTSLSLRFACGNPQGGMIEVRDDRRAGQLLGRCQAHFTGSWLSYRTVVCELKYPMDMLDMCLTFRGGGDELLRLKSFSFV